MGAGSHHRAVPADVHRAVHILDAMNMVFSFALKGAGDTRFVTLVALMVPWPIMVVPTYLMKDWNGAVYWAWGAASLFIISQSFVSLAPLCRRQMEADERHRLAPD